MTPDLDARHVGVSIDERGWPVFRVSSLVNPNPGGDEVRRLRQVFQDALDAHDASARDTNADQPPGFWWKDL